ncbi:cilia- and flagella-associated protein 36 isoform X2 [Leucoraja erinacea]|uniref:cilia- and flagella-associated protein 36 isoform X2 n=1 Tax=Leucoraja erinaceus TaxID=7782 RepID=UPI002457B6BB|nr:cilia- and flagella-associated protein 36 isoform X2 [Leucoraja erinacea]
MSFFLRLNDQAVLAQLVGCQGNIFGAAFIREPWRPGGELSRFSLSSGGGKMEEWVVEGIAGFLSSPCWIIPVTDFIEQNCAVFDDEEENKLSYTEIHQVYKDLVEQLLESYVQDVGIQEDQFLEACNSPLAQSESFRPVFQPVLAADDFQVFKSLMLQKNVELQLQALRMIQERNGALPECLTDGEDKISELEQQELRILREVLKQSKDEYEQEMAKRCVAETGAKGGILIQSDLEKAIVESADKETARLSRQHQQGKENLERAVQKSLQKRASTREDAVASTSNLDERFTKSGQTAQAISSSKLGHDHQCSLSGQNNRISREALGPVRAPLKGELPFPSESIEKKANQSDAAETWLQQAKKEAGILGSVLELSENERKQLHERAAYLKEQRDKLVAMKKEQREKHLPKNTETQHVPPTLETKEMSEEEKQKIQKRKHLAEKLKQEVIKK